MSFSDIFCQDRAIGVLQQAFTTGKIAHSYIFAGAEGVGKFTTACCWAKLLLCMSPVKTNGFNDSCGKCNSCRAFDANSHPDFHHIYKELIRYIQSPQKNKDKTPVELPREVIKELFVDKIQLKPVLSGAKVFVISEAEKLNIESQNLLLKTLEEPPNGSFIILLCTKLDNLLPTTRSRCQIVYFGPVSEDKIISLLTTDSVDEQRARFFARFAGGSVGRAKLLAKLEPCFYTVKKQLLQRLCSCKLADCVEFAEWINDTASKLIRSWQEFADDVSSSDISRQTKKFFVLAIISAFQDAMKLPFSRVQDMINFDQPQQIRILAERYGPQQCAELIEQCFLTNRFIDAAVNEKLIIESLLLKIVESAMMIV